MNQAKKAYEYLRKMVKGWIEDLNINLEKANDLLRNFHKWLTTHSNALYDPLLFKFVNELMKKMFSILIKKLNNFGLHIIYASFSKIIVATDKHTYKEAQNTISYILQKCASENEKLFGYLALQPLDNYYQVLLYKDPLNFVGIFVN
jgi:DNA polymerase epsilon subunit 1